MSTTAEKIAVMQGAENGGYVEYLSKFNSIWQPVLESEKHIWNWEECEYRIRPEPRRVWVVYFGSSLHGLYDSLDSAAKDYPKSGNIVEFIEAPKEGN